MGLAEQKRMALKEQVTFYSDETRARPVFAFKARRVMDLNAGYDITDEQGQQIGFFRKDFGASLLRLTFHLEGPLRRHGPGAQHARRDRAPVQRHPVPADPLRLPQHREGRLLLGVERQGSVRDKYTVHVPDPRVDFRVAASVAVAARRAMQR